MVKISKTYVPKEKEKYMCAKHLAFFKQKLNDWKADLIKTNFEVESVKLRISKPGALRGAKDVGVIIER